jgi:hypothetical protein
MPTILPLVILRSTSMEICVAARDIDQFGMLHVLFAMMQKSSFEVHAVPLVGNVQSETSVNKTAMSKIRKSQK